MPWNAANTTVLPHRLIHRRLLMERRQPRWEATVPAYRFYLLDARGCVIEARDVICDDDAGAEALARDIMAEAPQVQAVEGWLRPRFVCRVGSGEAKGTLAENPVVRAQPGSRRR